MTAARAPVAIVGIGCRFPGGVVDVESFWRLLAEGGDAITEIPPGRIDLERFYDPVGQTPGRMATRHGGYLSGIEDFDAAFFGLSERAAERMDPQQRLLLEVAWEALEDAGQDALALKGSRTGVFVGQWTSDYEARLFAETAGVDFDSANGSGRYAASGRISHLLGLRGPSLTLDAACSSSSMAVHLAVRSLQAGDCALALAGGVNIILQPHLHIAYSQVGMMAAGGACRFGDATRDGYVRSEGAGLVLLKPLQAAIADGDRIYAVITGGAINHDGDSGGSMGRPSILGQSEMLSAALDDASLTPQAIGYVEAHGTGTRAGDRVELAALAAVMGAGRPPGSPLLVGSVKTNIGHTEAAAGIASLIKAALVVERGQIPASLHFDEPDPNIAWGEDACAVVTGLRSWPQGEGPRRAGVTTFGVSGANCHLIVEQPPVPERQASGLEQGPALLPLSARSSEALRALAGRYAQLLERGARLADVCWSAATRRSALDQRAVFLAADRRELIASLQAYAAGAAPAELAGDTPLARLGRQWLQGGAVDWRQAMTPGAFTSLPLYPWRRQRYWIEAAARPAAGSAPAAPTPRDAVATLVGAAVAGALRLAPGEIDPDRPFSAMGLTSLAAMELRNQLQAALKVPLPATLAYNYPTLGALIRHLEAAADPVSIAPSPRPATVDDRQEPIAIVGAGLRLPGGVEDLAGYAELLWGGVDAVGEVPPERWPPGDGEDGRTLRHGAFLDGLDQFDAEFFGIAPREAASLDPQQRLLLEVAWEALETANQPPRALAGSATGVYVGMATSDYGRELFADPAALDAYASSGTAYGTAVGRLSYFLGLQGPSIAVDTACSSSLVAVHLAVQGLRLGECDLALAGGVNVILSPEPGLVFAKANMLAPDGRCRSFSADAAGYVRGEGCGMVVLRRLSDAQARGDRILAVIRGSATNQDGRSAGLTAPNGLAQEAVIKAALKAGGVDPLELSYVEAHGSGTPLGDPIEAGALGAALCAGRPLDQPLAIGSVKTNIGHLESAAGIAGLIKLLLAFERGEIPANLHFAAGNPHIDWAGLPIRVPTTAEAWRPASGRRLAGISSFGFGGSNAHVVLEGPPAESQPQAGAPERPVHLLVLSARDEPALRTLGERYLALLGDDARLADICHAAAAGRSHFGRRLAVIGATPEEMRGALQAALRAVPLAPAVAKVAPTPQFRIVEPGVGDATTIATLRETSPTFAAAFDEFIARTPGAPHLGLRHALAALWRSWGIAPVSAVADPVAPTVSLGGEGGGEPWRGLLTSLAHLYCAGVQIDWAGFDKDYARRHGDAPTYPFQRRRHWAAQVRAFSAPSTSAASKRGAETLMSRALRAPVSERRRLIVEQLRGLLASARPQGETQPLPLDMSLAKAGIDVMSTGLRKKIEVAYGRPLTPMLLLNYQTLEELAGHLVSLLASAAPEREPSWEAAALETTSDETIQARLRARLAQLK